MKRSILLTLFCIALPMAGYAQEIQAINVQQIDSFLRHIEMYNQGAGKVSIFRSGKEIYQRRFGNVPRPDSSSLQNAKYRIGSITKLFTATLIHQLFEQGRLHPETTLDRFYPDIPQADKITIRQLLNHTSGLGDYVFKENNGFFWTTQPLTEEEILQEINAQGVLFQPGDKVKYSNSGYYLLAGILEKIYQKTYPQLIEEQLLRPLALEHTLSGVVDDKTIAPSYYLNTHHEWHRVLEFYFPNVRGVGDLATTPEDLNIFIQALFSGKILSPRSLEKMMPDGKQRFGLGLMSLSFDGRALYGHTGETYGTRSILLYDPQTELSVAMSIHAQSAPFNEVFLGIMNGIYNQPGFWPDYAACQAYKADESEYPRYEGIYESAEASEGPSSSLKVYKKGEDLMIDLPEELPVCLEAFDNHAFVISPKKISIAFQPEKQQLTFTQRGKSKVYLKAR